MSRLTRFYFAFFVAALVRRMLPYAAIVYGFEVLGGHTWSGIFYFCLVTPYLLFSVAAGVVIDRVSPARVIRWSTFSAVACLGVLFIANHGAWLGGTSAHGWLLSALIFGYGTTYAIAYPAFIAAIPDVVPPAMAARSTVWLNVLALASLAYAPLLVGALREVLSWPWLFGSFAALALISAALTQRPPPRPREHRARASALPANAALALCTPRQPLGALLIVAAAFSALVVGPFEVLLPHFAEHTLHLGPFAAGTFIAVGGTGLVLGSIGALRLVDRPGLGPWLCACGMLGAACVVAMTYASTRLAFPLFFLSGVFGGLFSSLIIAGTQARAPVAVRGRVMGIFAVIFGGVPGLGGVAAGALAATAGTVSTIRIAFSAAIVTFALAFALLPALRNSRQLSVTGA